jgi:hypothetical protein
MLLAVVAIGIVIIFNAFAFCAYLVYFEESKSEYSINRVNH